jgi:hypothetical protein
LLRPIPHRVQCTTEYSALHGKHKHVSDCPWGVRFFHLFHLTVPSSIRPWGNLWVTWLMGLPGYKRERDKETSSTVYYTMAMLWIVSCLALVASALGEWCHRQCLVTWTDLIFLILDLFT